MPVNINNLKKQPFLIALAVNFLLFVLITACCFPVYILGDDLRVVYTLAGEFGIPSSICLPYAFNNHFFYNLPLQFLYQQLPSVNWYTVWLLFSQWLACSALYYVLLCRNSRIAATIVYIIFFLLIQTVMIGRLNTSVTSSICGIAGLALIWHYYKSPGINRTIVVGGIALLLLSAFFRLHTMVLVIGIAAPFFLLLPGNKKIIMAVGCIALAGLIVAGSYLWQLTYYKNHCAGFTQEEQLRQAKFEYINNYQDTSRMRDPRLQLQVQMASQLLFFDSRMPDAKSLRTITNHTRTSMPPGLIVKTQTWYWVFVNNRIFILSLVLCLLLPAFSKKERIISIMAVLMLVAGLFYLQVARKLPAYIIHGAVFTLLYFLLVTGTWQLANTWYRKVLQVFLPACIVLWSVVLTYKINKKNADQFRQFTQFHHEIQSRPQDLFIIVGDHDLFSAYYCFASPAAYSFSNMLFFSEAVDFRMSDIASRFGVKDIREAPLNARVYFYGERSPVLAAYYQAVLGKPVAFKNAGSLGASGELWKIVVQ
jgi:hypothetical protein